MNLFEYVTIFELCRQQTRNEMNVAAHYRQVWPCGYSFIIHGSIQIRQSFVPDVFVAGTVRHIFRISSSTYSSPANVAKTI